MARAGRPNKTNPQLDTISFAIKKGNIDTVKNPLMEFGVDSFDGYLRTPLISASIYNNTDLLIWLIDKGANVNHQDRNGFSALHFVGQEKQFESAVVLIEKKADLELKDRNGNTPLMTAIFNSKGNYQIVTLFIQAGANLDNKNNHEMTPRLLAESIAGFDFDLNAKT